MYFGELSHIKTRCINRILHQKNIKAKSLDTMYKTKTKDFVTKTMTLQIIAEHTEQEVSVHTA